MNKETTPAPAAPAPAPAAVPTTSPAPAVTPAPAAPALPPRDDNGRFTAPSAQSEPKPTLSAKKALRLDEDPSKSVDAILKKQRAGRKNVGGTDTEPPASPAAAAPVAAPVPVTPAAPAAPSAAPATPPTAPAAPASEPKVKVGDKEYTTAELEALLKQQAALAPAAPPAPAAQPEAPKQPTAEEIQAREQEFIQTAIQSMPATELTEEQLDTILAGGKEAVTLFDQLQRKAAAHAVLLASKNIATQLNPILAQLSQQLQPVVSQHIEVQRYQVEQAFLNKHSDFAPHIQTARQVAEALMVQYPQECAQMTQEAFIDEVARQTDLLLTADYRKFNPKATSWRQQAALAPAAPPAPTPAAPAAPVTPAPAAAPVPAPLAAVLPAGKSAANLPWAKGVAATLRG